MINKEDVKAVECRFAIHIPSKHSSVPDIHMVKEAVHLKDGSVVPNIRFIKDFKRPFCVTKPSKRNYEQKKEWMPLDNLLVKHVTQSKLRDEVARALEMGWSRDHMGKLSTSPYLFGSDISSTSLIKKMYQDKYPEAISPFTVCGFDIETDVLHGTEEPIMISVVTLERAFVAVTKDYLKGIACVEEQVQAKAKQYIGEYLTKYGMVVELYVGEDTVDIIKKAFERVHAIKPDFLEIWNMNFDIPKILDTLEKYKVDPRDVLCDPCVPKDLRVCKYKQGQLKQVTAGGKLKPINPALQWHSLLCTSSYYVIDGMAVYKRLRLQDQEEPSYSLDAILQKHLGIRKLKFKEADGYIKLAWHQFMQEHYKIEYIIYNIFDSLSMLELDSKIKDLAYTLPSYAGVTDFAKFKSQTKRIADAMHFYVQTKGCVIGTSAEAAVETEEVEEGEESVEVDEDDTLGLKGWILTLPAFMNVLGLPCIKEDPELKTGIRGYVYDSDATAAYPSATAAANVSKETTKREIITIEGVEDAVFRMENINLISGPVNALEYSTAMFKAPKPEELLEAFLARQKNN